MKLATRVLAPLVAVAALASCSPSPKVAAVVDGTQITEAQVTAAFDSCASGELPLPRAQVALYLFIDKVVDAVGERAGTSVDQAQVDEVLAGDPQTAALVGTPCGEALRGSIKTQFLTGDPAEIKAAVEALDYDVNPRYGVWNPENGLDPLGGSISVPEKDQEQS